MPSFAGMGRIDVYGNPGARDVEVETVRAIYDAFARRDVEAALAYIAEDVQLIPPGTAALVGRTEPYRGHAGVREYFADASRVWDDLTLHADDIRASAGGVAVFGHVSASVDGVRVERRILWTWQVRDGTALSIRINDIGAMPAP